MPNDNPEIFTAPAGEKTLWPKFPKGVCVPAIGRSFVKTTDDYVAEYCRLNHLIP